MRHRLFKSVAALLLLVIVTVTGVLLAWSADLLRSSFIRFVSWQSGRPIDVKLHGEPKRLRILRIKAPVLVQGTLLQPKFSVGVAESGLRPVDRGTPHDADCAALQLH